MKFLLPFLALPVLPLVLLACGGSTRDTSDSGGEAQAPIDSGVIGQQDASVDVAIDVPVEAAPTRDASAPAMLLYSGDGENFYDDTWEWNGTAWTQLLVPQPDTADGGSLGRSMHAMAQLGKQVVLFGGTANPGQVDLGDTWTWDGTNWTQQSPTVQPPTRYGAGCAFDAKLQMVVVFGGGVGGVDQNQTWVWTGADWTQLSTPKFPPARESMGMAYDGARGQLLLFGGLTGNTLFRDTWDLIGH